MAALERAEASADAQLAKMGYKAELPRNLSMMSILGLYVSRVTFYSAGPEPELTNFTGIGLSRLWVRSCSVPEDLTCIRWG